MTIRTLFMALMSCAMLTPVQAALKAGDRAPNFEAQASFAGKASAYSLRQALTKGPVVVYFYPSAFTSGCNVQAHAFAVDYEKFARAGTSVIGVSLDSIERLNDFSGDPEYCNSRFPVASDANGRIAKSYELDVEQARSGIKDTRGIDIDHGFAERTTFIVTPDGRIAATIGGMSPQANVARALEAVQSLQAGAHGK
ncbi:MAG TPA: peroxiredoxin [Usitatibacter sp.]|jgi:peroxiredoxin|nr:peroxiredoxin [Usitatibacter sp.]